MRAIKKLNPVKGMVYRLGVMPGYEDQDRSDVFRTVINDMIVDTVRAFDTKTWETGIYRDGEWFIVEQYKTRKLAETGHKKWVTKIKRNPKIKLEDLDLWYL